MTDVLLKTIPFFALAVFGFAAVKWRLFDTGAITGISRFVMFLALPALLFNRLATVPADMLINTPFLLAYLLAVLAAFAGAAVLSAVLFRAGPSQAVLSGLAGTYGNIGFLGLPLLTVLAGDWVTVPLAQILTFDLVVLVPLASAAIRLGQPGNGRIGRVFLSGLGALVRNPLILAIAAGAVFSLTRWPVPSPVLDLSALLSQAAAPCAMFVVGAVLAGRRTSAQMGPVLMMSAFKLALFPLTVWFVLGAFDIEHSWRAAASLGAAMPVAALLSVVADQYDVWPGPASMTVLLSTIVSVVTIAIALTLV